jgi:hypothetical protein
MGDGSRRSTTVFLERFLLGATFLKKVFSALNTGNQEAC